MKNIPGSLSTAAVDGHNSYVSVTASPSMTWKDRQRTRVPSFDLDDNPFCLERRANEERYKMQLNKVGSGLQLAAYIVLDVTVAERRRQKRLRVCSAGFFVDIDCMCHQPPACGLPIYSAKCCGTELRTAQNTRNTIPLLPDRADGMPKKNVSSAGETRMALDSRAKQWCFTAFKSTSEDSTAVPR